MDVEWGSNHNEFHANFIGTNASGEAKLGNGGDGLFIANSSFNTVGGTSVGASNVISSNGRNGVEIAGVGAGPYLAPSILNQVVNNRIGTDLYGAKSLGNKLDGVWLRTDFERGGQLLRQPDRLPVGLARRRLGHGVAGLRQHDRPQWVERCRGHGRPHGRQPGQGQFDLRQPENGHLLATLRELEPPASARRAVGTATVVHGFLTTSLTFPVSFSIDFYASDPADSPGFPQGERYLGTAVVTASGGYTPFAAVLAATEPGEVITATATDYWGTTTQFSIGATAR